MRAWTMAGVAMAAALLAGCQQGEQKASKIMESISPKEMTALLATEKYTVGPVSGDRQVIILPVSWPEEAKGGFEMQFTDCEPAADLADSKCKLLAYTGSTTDMLITQEQLNSVNSSIITGHAFFLPVDGKRLKKGTLIFVMPLPLYGGVTEDHVVASIAGWGDVLEGFIQRIHTLTAPEQPAQTPAGQGTGAPAAPTAPN